MKAIRIHEPTGIDGLVYEDVPDAKPGLCDVLVKVIACGITHNELDWPVWTCRAGNLARKPRTADHATAARLIDDGQLRPQVCGVYPLAKAAEAFRAKAAGGIAGRVVLQP